MEKKKTLQDVIYENFPNYRLEYYTARAGYKIDLEKWAHDLDVTYQTVWKWVSKNQIPHYRYSSIAALPNNTISLDKMQPFLSSRKGIKRYGAKIEE
jgi:hypothetical protein